MLSKEILTVLPYSVRTLRKLLASTLDESITFQQFRILNLIGEDRGLTEISELLQVSLAAVSKMSNTLVQKGLATRSPVKDRRCSGLKLTESGKKILKIITKQISRELDIKLSGFTKKDLTHLSDGLKVLEKLMGQLNEK